MEVFFYEVADPGLLLTASLATRCFEGTWRFEVLERGGVLYPSSCATLWVSSFEATEGLVRWKFRAYCLQSAQCGSVALSQGLVRKFMARAKSDDSSALAVQEHAHGTAAGEPLATTRDANAEANPRPPTCRDASWPQRRLTLRILRGLALGSTPASRV